MTKCLVVGAHVAGLGVIRSLGERGVPVVALHYQPGEMGQVSRYARERRRIPHPEAATEEFLGFLHEATDLHGGLLVPTEDAALVTLARHREELEGLYLPALPGWDVVGRIIDKKHTYELATRLGLPCPRTFTPASGPEAVHSARQVGFPCLVKPCVGHRFYELFGAKMVAAADEDSLLAACRLAWEAGQEVMVQELIPGDDAQGVNYNSYFWEGRPVAEFTASKVRLAPAGLGFPRVVVSRAVPEAVEMGRAILSALGFFGFSCTEFKRDPRDGRLKLMEVNGRHNVSSRLAVRCGLNFPHLMYEHLARGRLPKHLGPQSLGVYWIDEFKDAAFSLAHWGRERHPPSAYLRPYLAPHVFATFALRDPLPFVRRSGYLLLRGLAALGRKLKPAPEAVAAREKGRQGAGGRAPRRAEPA
jgi:predicted ATP-grasp superfamily ATP-dependent carboligase